jgi:XTP/dITP diphosphohydrolase
MDALKEELGDLQFHIAMISQLAKEQNAFDWSQITGESVDKLVERHPHVYGSTIAKTSDQVEGNWEQRKAQKQLKNKAGSILDSVSNSFPALLKAHKLGKKAAAVGFDWGKKDEALPQMEDKMREEWAELTAEITSGSKERQLEEFGDYLFVVAQYGRKLGLDPEEALTGACRKFIKRFQFMEEWHSELLESGQIPTLDQWEEAWAQAKVSQQSTG